MTASKATRKNELTSAVYSVLEEKVLCQHSFAKEEADESRQSINIQIKTPYEWNRHDGQL
jgi:hypothetical protein